VLDGQGRPRAAGDGGICDEAGRRGAALVILPIAQAVGELTATTKDTNAILHVTCGASRPAQIACTGPKQPHVEYRARAPACPGKHPDILRRHAPGQPAPPACRAGTKDSLSNF